MCLFMLIWAAGLGKREEKNLAREFILIQCSQDSIIIYILICAFDHRLAMDRLDTLFPSDDTMVVSLSQNTVEQKSLERSLCLPYRR